MRATDLRVGMKVKSSDGVIIKVTGTGTPDQYNECWFSGIVIETKRKDYEEYLNKDMRNNWNSAFFNPC